MKHNEFPSPTLPQLLGMNKSSISGLAYALKHNVKEDSDFGGHALQVVYLLLEYIENNMNESDTIIDVIKMNTDMATAIRNKDLSIVGLSCRCYNMLKRSGIHTIGDVEKLTSDQLMSVHNFGECSYNELIELLKKYGITLQEDKELAAIRAKEVEELGLSTRSFQCLKRAGLNTIGDIEKLSPSERNGCAISVSIAMMKSLKR